ncbi:MAG: hypothetical protein PHV35_09425, partial [Mariniphaga sp.]|nr:hypothetical protein [Mariniphaga sp.]
MKKYIKKIFASALVVLMAVLFSSAQDYLWQEPQATVTETGAVLWKPEAFPDDLTGQEVRYIDYENGNDSNDGLTPETPWKHHPWDYNATGNARAESGARTYVFKRGVFYRGQLFARESGTKEQPVR